MIRGFRDFIARGNVIDLAVAVVIGAAFSKVVDSVVSNLLNPLIGALGGQDLAAYSLCIKAPCGFDAQTQTITGVGIGWGAIVAALINFVLVAAAVYFLVVSPMNRIAARRAPPDKAEPAEEVVLLREIRDALTTRRAAEGPPER